MTKTVRIENACTSNFKVRVLIQDRKYKAEGPEEWETVKTVTLDYPTAMMSNEYITSSRRMIVEEYT